MTSHAHLRIHPLARWPAPRNCYVPSIVLSVSAFKRFWVVGQFAVAALSERRNSLRIQNRRSETAATKIKLTHYRAGESVANRVTNAACRATLAKQSEGEQGISGATFPAIKPAVAGKDTEA
jgi:hypothetical protein